MMFDRNSGGVRAAVTACGLAFSLACGVTAGPAWGQTFELATDEVGLTHTFDGSSYPSMFGMMSGGACVFDANGDGWPDIFAVGGGGQPDRLFINDGDGTFTDRAREWGVDARHRGGGCASADVNGDGLPDLFIVSMGDSDGNPNPLQSKLYINRGDRFEEVAAAAGVNRVSSFTDGFGVAFGDYDLDGDLDFFVSTWSDVDGGNRLYRNDAVGPDGIPLFSWVNVELGVDTNRLRGFTPRFADMNGDRYPDLLLTNDFNTSRYFESVVGPGGYQGFVDRTNDAGVTVDCNGMGATVGDIDNDGDLDWYVTNIYYPPPTSATCGNVLYLNGLAQGGGTEAVFEERAGAFGVSDGGWGWGTSLVDLDNDLDLDIVATSGWPGFVNKPLRVYEQQRPNAQTGALVFDEIADEAGAAFTGQGRGLVVLDADRDGDQDFYVIQTGFPARYYRNTTADQGRAGDWLRVVPTTASHPCLPPSGMHTRVRARIANTWQTREIDGAATYLGHSEQSAHFGIGEADEVEELRIEWADGTVTTMFSVAPAQTIEVAAKHPLELDGMEGLTIFDLLELLRRFGEGDQSPELDLNNDGGVGIGDLMRGVELLLDPCG